MTKSGKATSSPETSLHPEDRVAALVVSQTKRYPMFRVIELSGDGAFLGGKLLLEQGEALTLELRFADETRTEVHALVVAVESGDNPGIRVTWSGLSDANRVLLTKKRVTDKASG